MWIKDPDPDPVFSRIRVTQKDRIRPDPDPDPQHWTKKAMGEILRFTKNMAEILIMCPPIE